MKLKKWVKRILIIPIILLFALMSNAEIGMTILLSTILLVVLNVAISIEG